MGLFDWLFRLFGGSPGGPDWEEEPSAQPLAQRRAGQRATAAGDPERLAAQGLPPIDSSEQLAAALGIEPRILAWLAFPEKADEPRHYVGFAVKKRSGGYRVLYAPKRRLKEVQRWIHREILAKVAPSPAAHGFTPDRSIYTNADPHVGKDIVLTLDLEDFFPTVTYRRVRGIFQALGYGKDVAAVLARLCTVRPAPKVTEFLGRILHRMLPQGAPTSPAIANLATRRLDARLGGLAQKFGCAYTRYADDLTFSGDEAFEKSLTRFIPLLRRIIRAEGFRLNRDKFHFARRGARQQVTGLVVNDGLSVPRRYRRQLRAILHNARKTGLAGQNRDNHPHFPESLRGRIEFIRSTHPDLAEKLIAELNAIS
jgi:retron-type reverse transcriptase